MDAERPRLGNLGAVTGSLASLAAHYGLDGDSAARVLELAVAETLSGVFGFEVDACLTPEGEFLLTGYLRDPYGGIAEIRDIEPGSVSRNVCNLVNSRLHTALESASARVRACGLAPIAHTALPGRIVSAPVPGQPVLVELRREVQGWWGAPVQGRCGWRNTIPRERAEYAAGQERWWYVSAVYTSRAGRLRRLHVELSRTSVRLPVVLLRAFLREQGVRPEPRLSPCVRHSGRRSVVCSDRPIPMQVLERVSAELGEVIEVRLPPRGAAAARYAVREGRHVWPEEARV